ncbi:TonB-dependent siderophore receptor [Azospirillum picis]|uniref:Iron complex outermembrane receptor protein n=1 Tax=Azospirillum picis TaxID=488438 RepID=A0ABU0MML4_9PROT|nr:TonB-dependent siderophore receptor [Azospirillum picis]MBP2300749.1 iron complex outermembrane receptor protein [Azospirillum picis]MDQ0534718.1 iron complex outermembrane receptor protein [Azospirillum picis]
MATDIRTADPAAESPRRLFRRQKGKQQRGTQPHAPRLRATRLPLRMLLLASMAAVALGTAAAQAQPAAVTELRQYDIRPQPLSSALTDFASRAGIQLLYSSDMTANLRSPGVSGRLSVDQALPQLLAGTGLGWRYTDAVTVTLMPAPGKSADAAGTVLLPEVTVQATAWRSWQPVEGYVAGVTTTGTKTDTPLIESPQSVSVVTRDQMDDQGSQTVSQTLRYTPGVLAEVRPSARYDSVFVRGFGGQGAGAAYVNFLDGLRQQRSISYAIPTVDPWLLERIEILRGPASVLYGQAGSGGVVNLVSRRPTDADSHEVRVEAGSNGRVQTMFDTGGALTEDGQFLYRLTGIGRKSGTQYDDVDDDRIAIAPAFTWKPSSDTSLTVLSSYQRDPEGGFYNFAPALGSVLPNRNGKIGSGFYAGDPAYDNYSRNSASIGYQFEHRLSDVWTLRQNARYNHLDSSFKAISLSSLQANQRTANRSISDVNDMANTVAVDNQAQATVMTGPVDHTLLFGADWSRGFARRDLGQFTGVTVPTLDIFNPVYGYRYPVARGVQTTRQIQTQLGFYAQDQLAYENWRMTVGLRHDRADSETVQLTGNSRTSQSDDAFTWRAGLLYLFDNGITPYVNYSTSFLPNSGSYSPARGGDAFKPTEGEQYEAGIKYQPPGMNSFVQVAGYSIRQRDVLTADPLNTLYSVQTGEIRSRGIEVEGRASLTSSLDLIGAYSFIDAEVTRSNTAGVAGNRVPQVPRHMVSGWVNYRFQSGPLAGLELGGGVRYIGPTAGNDVNSFEVPGYTLADAAVRYDLGALKPALAGAELTLNVSNLFDKEYVSSCSSATACYFGDRRLVLAGVRYKW